MANEKISLDICAFIKQIKEDNCFYYNMTDTKEPYYGKITLCFTHGVITVIKKEETIK